MGIGESDCGGHYPKYFLTSGSLTREPLYIAGELLECRGFQFFQVTLAGRRQRKNVLGDFERRSGFAMMEPAVSDHFVQGLAEGGDR